MKTDTAVHTFTAFVGERCIGAGSIEQVALQAKALAEASPDVVILFFDDRTGSQIDLDLRGSDAEVAARLAGQFLSSAAEADEVEAESPPVPRRRGRPKLGVVAREVTLLPRHWEWLDAKPGSASVTLRKLVDEARRSHAERDRRQQAQNATYSFMSAMAGNREHFEEASRALFAGEGRRFRQLVEHWPADIRRQLERLSAPAFFGESATEET
jgi:hypothetical protein